MQNDKRDIYSDQSREDLHSLFRNQSLLIERLYKFQFENEKDFSGTRLEELYLLLFSMTYTGSAISILASRMQKNESLINECYMLSRSLLERIITYLYLLFCEEEEFNRFLQYSQQKGFRVLDRKFSVGDKHVSIKVTDINQIEISTELREALNQFTSKRGKVITRWTTSSIANMLEVINSKGNIKIEALMFAVLGIYDDASEALHGTIFGTTFHLGHYIGNLPNSVDELKRNINGQYSTLFLMLSASINTLFKGYNELFEIKDILLESNNQMNNS